MTSNGDLCIVPAQYETRVLEPRTSLKNATRQPSPVTPGWSITFLLKRLLLSCPAESDVDWLTQRKERSMLKHLTPGRGKR